MQMNNCIKIAYTSHCVIKLLNVIIILYKWFNFLLRLNYNSNYNKLWVLIMPCRRHDT